MVGVLSAGEFIVGLQIVRADIERLSLRMVAEIEIERGRARLPAQQESPRKTHVEWRVRVLR